MSASRKGRRPGDSEVTRQSILDAASTVFGSVGYERATMRRIGEEAGVDPALIHHYFGTKQGLFAATHELPFNPARAIAALGAGPEEELGRRLAQFYLEVFADTGSPAVSMVRSAATNEDAANLLREFIDRLLATHAARITSRPRPRLRLALAASHMIGVIFAREIVGIRELANTGTSDLVEAVAPALQYYLVEAEL